MVKFFKGGSIETVGERPEEERQTYKTCGGGQSRTVPNPFRSHWHQDSVYVYNYS